MIYLLYIRDGVIRKFPLQKKILSLGRSPQCDFYLDEDFISKKHVSITCMENAIKIRDLTSKNGTYVENLRITEAQIDLNQSFSIGHLVFYLKNGNPHEFLPADGAKTLIEKVSHLESTSHRKTKTCLNLFDKALITILRLGFRLDRIDDILQWAKTSLNNTLKSGQLTILCEDKLAIKTISQLTLNNGNDNNSMSINPVDFHRDSFTKESLNQTHTSGAIYYSFPLELSHQRGLLVYTRMNKSNDAKKVTQFLREFAIEISLIYRLIEKDRLYRQSPGSANCEVEIITRDDGMLNLLEKCKKIAGCDLFVLMKGETGTGKELVARFIHHHSHRNRDKYIGINCSAIPYPLLEEELFGHEKGAFTGAYQDRKGKLELASNGTLVLDEIGDMPPDLQTKLLRVLQENEFFPLGSNRKIKVDLRIISLSHQDLPKLITQGLFREDLYYRLAHVTLEIPPLKERPGDIRPLIDFFFEQFSRESRIYTSGFSRQTLEALVNYPWPGNVRELQHEIKSLVNQSHTGDIINFDLLKSEIKAHYSRMSKHPPETSTRQKIKIMALLEEHRWNKSLVAKQLQISRTALYKKLKKMNIR